MKHFIDTEFTTITQDGQETRVPDLNGYEADGDVQYSVMDRGDGTCLTRVTAPAETMDNIVNATETTLLTDEEAEESLGENRERASLENLDQPDVEVDQMLNEHSIDDVLTDADKDVANIVLNWSSLGRGQQVQILRDYDSDSPQDLVEDVSVNSLAEIVDGYAEIDGIPDYIDTATAARIATQRATSGNQTLQDQELTALDKAAIARECPNCDEIPNSTRGESPESMSGFAKEIVNGGNYSHNEMLEYVKGNTDTAPWK